MEYKLLGNTGVKVSPLCFGTMTFGDPLGVLWINSFLDVPEQRPQSSFTVHSSPSIARATCPFV